MAKQSMIGGNSMVVCPHETLGSSGVFLNVDEGAPAGSSTASLADATRDRDALGDRAGSRAVAGCGCDGGGAASDAGLLILAGIIGRLAVSSSRTRRRLSLLALLLSTIAAPRDAAAKLPDESFECVPVPPSRRVKMTLKAESTMPDLAEWISSVTCKNVVFSSDVTSCAPTVTIVSPKPMNAAAAVRLFVEALASAGLRTRVTKESMVVSADPSHRSRCPGSASAPVQAAPAGGPSPAATLAATPPEAELRQGIRQKGPADYEVSAALLKSVLATDAFFARSAPIVSDRTGQGLRLYAIHPASFFAALGLRNGDLVRSANGKSMSSPDEALSFYASLRTASQVVLKLIRGGQQTELRYRVR